MKRKTVSLCMIARDEEATIGTTIKSVLALVDEIIVVDTGSRDNTAIIAEGYGARVLDAPWEDDFAAARNRAIDAAGGDWILVLDADEYLQSVRPVDFQRLLHAPRVAAYTLDVVDDSGREVPGGGNRVRLFRNHPLLRFSYPIHDNVEAGLGAYCRATGHEVVASGLTVINEGLGAERAQQAARRKQRILRLARRERPDEPYFAYLNGCCSLQMLGDDVLPTAGVEAALAEMEAAWNLVGVADREAAEAPGWLPDLGCRLISGRLATGALARARRIAADLLALYPHEPCVLLQGVAADLARLREIRGAQGSLEFRQTAARIESWLERIADHRLRAGASGVENRRLALYPLRYRGELALLLGRVSEAVTWFEQALDLDPSYSQAWLGMAECCEFAGDRKRALKLYLRTVAACPDNYRAWLQGSLLMRGMDCPGNARTWWNRFCSNFPAHPAARLPEPVTGELQTC